MSRDDAKERLRHAAHPAPFKLALETVELTRRHPKTVVLLVFVVGLVLGGTLARRGLKDLLGDP